MAADPVTAKCAVTGACLTSAAAFVEYFAPFIPTFLWGLVGAAAAWVLVPQTEALSTVRALLRVFVAALLASGSTAWVAGLISKVTGQPELNAHWVIAIVLGIVAPTIVRGLAAMSIGELSSGLGGWLAKLADLMKGGRQ